MTNQADYQGDWLVFAGNYGPASGEQIARLIFRPATGKLELAGGTGGIENASYLAFDEQRDLLYAVSETGDGAVVAYAHDRASGALTELSRQSAHGQHTCHLVIDPHERRLHVANYTSGNYIVLPIGEEGAVGPVSDEVQHAGHSVNPERQSGPHVHSVFNDPSGRYQVVCDLGLDKVLIYRTNAEGRIEAVGEFATPAGTGPRHLVFHPSRPYVYVLGEMGNQVHTYSFEDSVLDSKLVQSVDTLPAGYDGESTTAAIRIHPTGRWVYASNRGHDSISVFSVGEDGRLTPAGQVPTGGRTPRDFMVLPDGRYLFAANQDSGTVVVFAIGEDGVPVPNGETLALGKPVTLVAAPLR